MTNGQCAPVRNNTDPDNECAAENATTCGRDGMCNGARGCRLHASGTVCEEAKCATNRRSRLSDRRCNGQGTCSSPTSTDCAPLQVCEGSGANTRCNSPCDELSDPCCEGGVCDRAANGRQLYCVGNPSNGATSCEHCGRIGERCCTDASGNRSCDQGVRCLMDTQVPVCVECGRNGLACCPGASPAQQCTDGSICRGPRGFCGPP
jgi:hypothetical protein